MSDSTANGRAIQAAIAPLMGPVATGQVLVRSVGPSGSVPFGACAIPVVRGGIFEEATVFVSKNPANEDGDWPVTQAGVLLPVQALQGGVVGNQPPGTEYLWDLPIEGIEPKSSSPAGLTGGVAPAPGVIGAVRQLALYKQLGQANFEQFIRAGIGKSPAICLAWESTAPNDGPMAAQGVARLARMGRGKFLFRHTWALFIVTARLDTEAQRRREGDVIRDEVLVRLLDTMSARGLRLANEPGAQILDARVFGVTPTSYVDLVRIGCTVTLQHKGEPRDYADWLRTRTVMPTAPNGEGPSISPPINVVDVTDPMPPNGSAP